MKQKDPKTPGMVMVAFPPKEISVPSPDRIEIKQEKTKRMNGMTETPNVLLLIYDYAVCPQEENQTKTAGREPVLIHY